MKKIRKNRHKRIRSIVQTTYPFVLLLAIAYLFSKSKIILFFIAQAFVSAIVAELLIRFFYKRPKTK
jgi:hypothetical protein